MREAYAIRSNAELERRSCTMCECRLRHPTVQMPNLMCPTPVGRVWNGLDLDAIVNLRASRTPQPVHYPGKLIRVVRISAG